MSKQTDHNGQPLTYWGGLAENKKQTAVEWLFDKITQNQDIRWRGTQYEDLFEQAKAMEKEQIENAFENGVDDIIYSRANYEDGEQYYNETYGGDTIQNKQERMYSEEEVHNLLDTLLEGDMCSVAGDELIEQFKHKITCL